MLHRNFYSKLVLLADDHQDVREITANMIRSLGYNVLTFPSGYELLEFYQNNMDYPIKFFFLDLVMNKMSGVSCAEQILQTNPDAKIIIYSGYPEHESLSKIKKLGIGELLAKPFKLDKLSHTVNDCFTLCRQKQNLSGRC